MKPFTSLSVIVVLVILSSCCQDVMSGANIGPWRKRNLLSPAHPLIVGKDLPFAVKSLTTAALTASNEMMSRSSGIGSSVSHVSGESNEENDNEKSNETETMITDDVSTDGNTTRSICNNITSEEAKIEKDKSATTKKKFFKLKRKKVVDPNSTAARYAKKLKNRNTMNIKRKLLHTSWGFLFAALNQAIPRSKFIPCMTVLTSATLLMELLRYRKHFGWMNDALHFVLGSQLRKHEMEGKFTGSTYYFLGVTVSAHLFPKSAATLGIIQLALADPAASYFGRRTRHVYWSRIERGFFGIGRNKGVLGFLGGALVCFPFNYRVLKVAQWGGSGIPGGKSNLLVASLLLGAAGAFADLIVPTPAVTMPSKLFGIPMPPLHIDDNVVVPVVSSFACTKIFALMGWDDQLSLAKYILF
mmetsp:Transcript_32341/g.39746  ORF Transcript_32341/g.39746 Transcript_32341/m.39746 type:complete len:415 (+) Transcript_32341:58-1302(+)|eukprot:CAMPEP_0172501084 /NCGR_PEP_ID=MMETSP1066-20121228/145966_1 /TAXON_ID=671091 /ORGANISM="Coscinodiscus wailesii, Strain CCMP2513" /LENGTH=414 /DNA_ID=CAMNT_0013275683 /DNA_START=39 /DNA_END=1283 /DNA_ORIENTATION=-